MRDIKAEIMDKADEIALEMYNKHWDKHEQLEFLDETFPDDGPKHQWVTNPLKGLNQIPKNEDEITRKENKPLRQLRNFAIKGLADQFVPGSGQYVAEPILNRIGNIEDKRLGIEIKKQDKLLTESYNQLVNTQGYTPEFIEQMELLFPNE